MFTLLPLTITPAFSTANDGGFLCPPAVVNRDSHPRHKGNTRAYWLLPMLLLLSVLAVAQDNTRVHGWIRDAESGKPIFGVQVDIPNSPHQTQSDINGYFSLENVPVGLSDFRFSRMDYTTHHTYRQNITEETVLQLQIKLKANPISAKRVLVEAQLPRARTGLSGESFILNREEIERYGGLGISQLMRNLPGLEIRQQGGTINRAEISLHGSPGNQVLVLLDNQRLNDVQDGTVDLSVIPFDQLQRIEVVRHGNTALYGSHAFAGVVKFITRPARNREANLEARLGENESAGGNVGLQYQSGLFSLSLRYGQSYARQDFDYRYEAESFTRRNAWQRSRQTYSRLDWRPYPNHHLKALFNWRKGAQGIPSGFYEEWDPFRAQNDVRSSAIQLEYQWLLKPSLYWQIQANLNQIDQNYVNTEPDSPFLRYHYVQKNQVDAVRGELFWQGQGNWDGRFGGSYQSEKLDHQNRLFPQLSAGKNNRQSRAVFAAGEYSLAPQEIGLKELAFRGVLRYESLLGSPAEFFPALNLSFTPQKLSGIGFSGGWSRSIRYPDFNSLFWKGDARAQGNPNLLPERNSTWFLSSKFYSEPLLLPKLNIYWFYEESRDLIFWHQGVNGIWEPRNEEKARKRGIDISVEQWLLPRRLQATINYSYVDALNLSPGPNRFNRQLVFIPNHTWDGRLLGTYRNLQLLLGYRAVSQREVTQANTGEPLPAYQLLDFSLGYALSLNGVELLSHLSINNITNEDYALLRGYPMPRRNLHLNLQLNFKSKVVQ